MKKAKLMLSALGILMIIGTSFAFKAKKFTNHFVYTGIVSSGVCTFKLEGAAITSLGRPTDSLVAASIVSKITGCPDRFTIEILD